MPVEQPLALIPVAVAGAAQASVRIMSKGCTGTGCLLSTHLPLALTAAHVVLPGRVFVQVSPPWKFCLADVVARCERYDLALLRLGLRDPHTGTPYRHPLPQGLGGPWDPRPCPEFPAYVVHRQNEAAEVVPLWVAGVRDHWWVTDIPGERGWSGSPLLDAGGLLLGVWFGSSMDHGRRLGGLAVRMVHAQEFLEAAGNKR